MIVPFEGRFFSIERMPFLARLPVQIEAPLFGESAECGADARMELDRAIVPVKPGMCILIPPEVRHRAIGEMKVLIVALPKFDPDDEWFD